jgi:hypothetical protein
MIAETEGRGGWTFEAQILDDAGALRRHRLTLSWADYNLWSTDGADEPAKVAEAAMMFLLARAAAADVPERFDASLLRRRFPEADQCIPGLIRR